MGRTSQISTFLVVNNAIQQSFFNFFISKKCGQNYAKNATQQLFFITFSLGNSIVTSKPNNVTQYAIFPSFFLHYRFSNPSSCFLCGQQQDFVFCICVFSVLFFFVAVIWISLQMQQHQDHHQRWLKLYMFNFSELLFTCF